MKNHLLTDHELNLVNYKLAADNNAMLRILLENQLKIMDMLGISDSTSKFSFESVYPNADTGPEQDFPRDELSRSEYMNSMKAAGIISTKLTMRCEEWLQLEEKRAADETL